MELHLKYIFTFGQHKGLKLEDVIVLNESYLDWMIGNFQDLIFSPDLLKEILAINPYFMISPQNYDALHNIIRNFRIENIGMLDENSIDDKSYINYFNLTNAEILKGDIVYKQKLDIFLKNEELKSSQERDNSNLKTYIMNEHDDHHHHHENCEKYAGSYAQDIEGLSDDFIDDVLDGDPDAYWNID